LRARLARLFDRALEAGGVGQAAALEAEGRHRRLPAVAGSADQVAVGDDGVVEEDLAELAATGQLADPAHLDARLLQVDDEVADALVGRSLGVGAGEQEAAVGVVGPRRPDLLAVEDPAVSVLDRTGREAGQVAAGVGLAEALRPDLLAGEELLDVGVLLPLAAEDVDRRRREADTETAEDGRSADRGQLLLVDRLLDG